jgi:hypothetical protein
MMGEERGERGEGRGEGRAWALHRDIGAGGAAAATLIGGVGAELFLCT